MKRHRSAARFFACRPGGTRGFYSSGSSISRRASPPLCKRRCRRRRRRGCGVAPSNCQSTAGGYGRIVTARKNIEMPSASSAGNAVSAFRMRRRRITPSVSLCSTPPSKREAIMAPPYNCRSIGGRSMIAPTLRRRRLNAVAGVCRARIPSVPQTGRRRKPKNGRAMHVPTVEFRRDDHRSSAKIITDRPPDAVHNRRWRI